MEKAPPPAKTASSTPNAPANTGGAPTITDDTDDTTGSTGATSATGSSGTTGATGATGATSSTGSTGQSGSTGSSPPTDFLTRGARQVTQTAGTLSLSGCSLAYTSFTPSGAASPALVVLGHGFVRKKKHLVEVADHIASFGVRVVTPDYCHSTVIDTDHEQNGLDAVALAAALAPGTTPVIYAGHSAGGLAALVAAAQDPRTQALLGLDLTDSDDIGLDLASTVSVPALGLFGAGSSCNASGNGVAVFGAVSGASKVSVTAATHCDFEGPTTAVCTIPCGAQAANRVAVIRALAAAFVAWKSGADATGEAWVSANGSEFVSLNSAGKISPLP